MQMSPRYDHGKMETYTALKHDVGIFQGQVCQSSEAHLSCVSSHLFINENIVSILEGIFKSNLQSNKEV